MVMFLVFSGMPNADDDHIRGVGILVNRNIRGALLEWNPVSERIITVRIQTKLRQMSKEIKKVSGGSIELMRMGLRMKPK